MKLHGIFIKYSIVSVTIITLLLIGACAAGRQVTTSARIKIEFGDDAVESWKPSSVVIPKGTAVEFVNTGYNHHALISGEGLFNQNLSPGQSFKYIFPTSGNFTYHDDLSDPYSEINKIIVR